MDVCCECCVLSGRDLCDELITRPEEPYRLWCVVVCDLETSWMRRPWPTGGCCAETKRNLHLELLVVHFWPLSHSFSFHCFANDKPWSLEWFEILTTLDMKFTVFRYVTSFPPSNGCPCFESTCCLVYPKHKGRTFLQNVDTLPPDCTLPNPENGNLQ